MKHRTLSQRRTILSASMALALIGLAATAWAQDVKSYETDPKWRAFLRSSIRKYMTKSLEYWEAGYSEIKKSGGATADATANYTEHHCSWEWARTLAQKPGSGPVAQLLLLRLEAELCYAQAEALPDGSSAQALGRETARSLRNEANKRMAEVVELAKDDPLIKRDLHHYHLEEIAEHGRRARDHEEDAESYRRNGETDKTEVSEYWAGRERELAEEHRTDAEKLAAAVPETASDPDKMTSIEPAEKLKMERKLLGYGSEAVSTGEFANGLRRQILAKLQTRRAGKGKNVDAEREILLEAYRNVDKIAKRWTKRLQE